MFRILEHAFGARYDLPIPLYLFVLGGALVVVVSFLLVEGRVVAAPAAAATADRARLHDVRRGDWRDGVGTLAVLVLGFLIWCGLTGSQEVAENIVPTTFWLMVWIAVPLSCGVVGDWTKPMNPFAYLAGVADSPRARQLILGSAEPVRWPGWLGWWPAVVIFFITACGELIYNLTVVQPDNTALALLVYAAFTTLMGFLFGRPWRERGEMFTVLYATWGRLGYFRFGAPGRRRFAGGLDVPFEPTVSRVAFVLFLLISVNFDGLLATPKWAHFEDRFPGSLTLHPDRLQTFRTITFVVLALTVLVLFGLFALASSYAGRHGTGFIRSLTGLLPSLLPIAFGYLLAHNIQYVLVNAQLLAPLIGNPPGQDSWPLHLPYPFNDSYEPNPHFLPSSFYWYFSIAVIVLVHVIAVVIAHRYLQERGSSRAIARRSEYPWLVAMVGYTMFSLWLIAQPLVKESGGKSPQQSGAFVPPTTSIAATQVHGSPPDS